jgi:lipid A 3-O-deacylase
MPSMGITLGNVYTLAQTGLSFRFAPYKERYADLPPRVRPSIPGSGYFPKLEDKWSWGLFGSITGYAVGRNIFLDGNSFTNSPSVTKENFVYDTSIGFDTIYSNTRLSYTLTKRSKEFETQKNNSIFGSFSITRRF